MNCEALMREIERSNALLQRLDSDCERMPEEFRWICEYLRFLIEGQRESAQQTYDANCNTECQALKERIDELTVAIGEAGKCFEGPQVLFGECLRNYLQLWGEWWSLKRQYDQNCA